MRNIYISMILLLITNSSMANEANIETKKYEIGVENTISGAIITIASMLEDKVRGLNQQEKEQYYLFKDKLNDRLQSNSIIQKIHFKTNNNEIKNTVVNYLSNVVLSLDNFKDINYQLKGYSDSRGSNESNYILAKKRLDSVYEILVAIGVPEKNITRSNYGESKSKTYKSVEDYFFDRRVELVISK